MTQTKSKTKAPKKTTESPAQKKAAAKGALIVLVTGSRQMVNYDYLDKVLSTYKIGGIVHGDAIGADTLTQKWAEANDVLTQRHPVTEAQWKRIGKRAGILRNQFMLNEHPTISLVIAFPVKGSRGTKDMMSRAMNAGIDLHVYTAHGCSA